MNDCFSEIFKWQRKQRFNEVYAKILKLYKPIVALPANRLWGEMDWWHAYTVFPYATIDIYIFKPEANYLSCTQELKFTGGDSCWHRYCNDGIVYPGKQLINEYAGYRRSGVHNRSYSNTYLLP